MSSTSSTAGRAAAAIGCTVSEYVERQGHGEKWCGGCKQWHDRSAFGRDRSRGDGLATRCRVAKNGHLDHATTTNRPRGRRYVAARNGDRVQARQRVSRLVAVRVLPAPDEVQCADCGHEQGTSTLRHQYDHYRGYEAEHHDHVEAVCTPCHYRREVARGAHQNAHTPRGAYRERDTLGIPASHIVARLGGDVDKVGRLIDEGRLNVFPAPGVKLVTTESWRRYRESAGVSDVA